MGSDGIDDVIKWAESQGWTVETDSNGYRRFYDPRGNYIVRHPATPSNPHRRRLDVLTKVKKAGLPWPAPSKKEQRALRNAGGREVTDDWVISFTFDVDPSTETMDLWESQLEGLDGSVARIPGRGVDVTVYASGDLSMFGTIEKMANEVTHVVQAEPIAAEILGETQWQLRGAAPTMPELMSAAEIADELKISRQRVHQLRETPSFPAPLANLRGGAVWDAEAIRRFNAEWTRTPGRPRVASTVVRVSKPVPQRRAKRISGQIAAVGKSRAKKAAARKLSPAPGMSRRSPGS